MNAPYQRYASQPPSSPMSGGAETRMRILEGGFLPDMTLDGWLRTGDAMRAGALLVTRDGRKYQLVDALRVLGRRNGDTDPYGLTGRVDTLREMLRQGATLGGGALRLGPAVYDIEFGSIARSIASADESGAAAKIG